MRRFKLLGLALVAVLASAAAMSASALAVETPENLPVSTVRTWTGKNIGNTVLHAQGQEPITCTEAEGEGTETSSKPPSGLFHIHFKNCTTKSGGLTVKCTGLSDKTAGTILALGTWKLIWDKLVGKPFENLTTAILFTNEAVHFVCGGLVLVEVLANGQTLCLDLNPLLEGPTHEFHCIGSIVSGVPTAVEEFSETEKGVFKVPVLQASVSEAKPVPALQLGLGTILSLLNGKDVTIVGDH